MRANHRSVVKPCSEAFSDSQRRMTFSWVVVSLGGRPDTGLAAKPSAPAGGMRQTSVGCYGDRPEGTRRPPGSSRPPQYAGRQGSVGKPDNQDHPRFAGEVSHANRGPSGHYLPGRLQGDRTEVLDQDGRSLLVRADDNLLDVLDALRVAPPPDHVLCAAELDQPPPTSLLPSRMACTTLEIGMLKASSLLGSTLTWYCF